MIFTIPNLLSVEELETIMTTLADSEFVAGKLTAGRQAKLVKNNQQVKSGTLESQKLKQIVQDALKKNTLFQAGIRPKKIHSLLFSRYDAGMSYGRHSDNALMGEWRSDVSWTIFLNDPLSYKGGELAIEGADDEKYYKLAAGSAVFYPSSTLHRVDPVTEGTRFVAVGWVQSRIRDPGDRELLFDLDTAKRGIFAKYGKIPEVDLLGKSLSNLLRKWAE
ncbi:MULTISPECIES: Fe2+-dependent dioxygenase [Spirulina sp. CCY15215]|uniref:Fe2+-dependent dioxygenase n=1 Tax=Spirulina sp. CCY15215 TaxID=2767591 RepID=UPI00194E9C46|nr:Fe2+-dependent dioxygenase [Spirulina major]